MENHFHQIMSHWFVLWVFRMSIKEKFYFSRIHKQEIGVLEILLIFSHTVSLCLFMRHPLKVLYSYCASQNFLIKCCVKRKKEKVMLVTSINPQKTGNGNHLPLFSSSKGCRRWWWELRKILQRDSRPVPMSPGLHCSQPDEKIMLNMCSPKSIQICNLLHTFTY